MRYRPEIDGLRAVAVIPVIFFHAGFESFSGGFVGVDVFFVISGYLITGIILSDLDDDKFSLITFYERRARRILPALFFVMAVCIPFAWAWLMPRDMNDFVQSLIAVSTYTSNFLFWRESGYFATEAELKPLLHTWSLAVEEQYYILYPVTLILIWRLGKRWVIGLLAVAFVLSLSVAHWGALNRPAAAFYLLPTRGWELILGAFAAFFFSRYESLPIRKNLSDALGLIGLILIAYAIVVFDKSTPFPGLYALVPTIGTLLIILCAQNGTIVQWILRNKLFVGVGLISYSAYLWHQPLLAFAKHKSITEPSAFLMSTLCLAAFPLAYLSWRYVEKPFRNRQLLSRKFIFTSAIVASTAFVAFGLVRHSPDSFEEQWLARQPIEVQQTYKLINVDKENANYGVDDRGRQDDGICRFNVDTLTDEVVERLISCTNMHGKGVVILGDSHSADLFGVITSNRKDDFIVGITRAGCRPGTALPQCHYDDFLSFVRENPDTISHVIYEQAGVFLLRTEKGRSTREFFSKLPLTHPVSGIFVEEQSVEATYQYLRKLSDVIPVLWFGPRVEPHITDKMILSLGCDHSFKLRTHHREIFEQLDSYISNIAISDERLAFLSQNNVFDFNFPSDFMSCDQIFWSDSDHFSADGEKRFGARFDLIQYVKDKG